MDEGVHTINLGKVMLSQSQHRAVRAINMIREYVYRHAHTTNVKIDQELAQQIWARGVRRPPRKISVELVEDDDAILVLPYKTEETASAPPLDSPVKDTPVEGDTTSPLPDKATKPELEDKNAQSAEQNTEQPDSKK